MTRAEIDQWAEEHDVELLFLEPADYDAAIVGLGERFTSYFLIYDLPTVLAIMTRLFDGDEEAAEEWFSFNTLGAWMGDATPCFLSRELP